MHIIHQNQTQKTEEISAKTFDFRVQVVGADGVIEAEAIISNRD